MLVHMIGICAVDFGCTLFRRLVWDVDKSMLIAAVGHGGVGIAGCRRVSLE